MPLILDKNFQHSQEFFRFALKYYPVKKFNLKTFKIR